MKLTALIGNSDSLIEISLFETTALQHILISGVILS